MIKNTLQGREALQNTDNDICIYGRYTEEAIYPYKGTNMLFAVHNGKKQLMWSNIDDSQKEPKTGDICMYCKREILIFE